MSCILDFFVGDPSFIPHPVVIMGKTINILEKFYRFIFPKNKYGELVAGFFMFITVSSIFFLVPLMIITFLRHHYPVSKIIVETFWGFQCLAARSLWTESMNVYTALGKSLEDARIAVSRIVGRDVSKLDENGVIRAAVETVAENTTDGVIAPFFYLVFGGAPLVLLYKAVNTMDSMCGYKNEKYRYFGFFCAKADDVLNFIPARLSAVLMLVSTLIIKLDFKNALKIFRRDRYKHASPNSAQTESVCAGALNIRLAGDAYYEGVLEKKPFIGDDNRNVEAMDIFRANMLMWTTYILNFVLSSAYWIFLISVIVPLFK
ncbi:MAG: adenosylcobinamide-phosphate synthase CbiB [Treponema sp.]|nr:adenosylcobinamide-phosphate synthase CbiB [Treponema sp.]